MSAPTFKRVPKTGVVYVMSQASKLGFYRGNPDWCNLGQGQPEVGLIQNGIPRVKNIDIDLSDHEYSPTPGLKELREAIAKSYNDLYRVGKASQYTAANVAVCPGGRSALTRLAASIGNVNVGHFIPDYTAYEEMLSVFNSFNTIPILLEGSSGYNFTTSSLIKEIQGKGLAALLLSNPCNPTGKLICGNKLKNWVNVARDFNCSIIMDEFYSSYIYSGTTDTTVSAARYVEDVNEDPIVIVNGLTKNWRYPGWRIAWIVAPENVISSISSAGSFLDGGSCRPFQREAIALMEAEKIEQEAKALQTVFREKRRILLDSLQTMGVTFDSEPNGAFYAWGDVSALPEGLNDGMKFFEACLEQQIVVVPGEFFDINPGKRRSDSRFKNHVRFSFGPELHVIEEAVSRFKKLINK